MALALRLVKAYDALLLTCAAWLILGVNAVSSAFLYGGMEYGLALYVAVIACAVVLSGFAFIRALRWRRVALGRCIAAVAFSACSWACWAVLAYVSVASASRCC
jgi:hypothetical protein